MRTETVRAGLRVEGSVEASVRAAGLQMDVVPRVAEAFQAMDLPAEKWDARPMNLGTGKILTIRKLAEIIRDVSGSKSEITTAPAREGDVEHSLANAGRGPSLTSSSLTSSRAWTSRNTGAQGRG